MKSKISWSVKLYQPEVDSAKWRLFLRFLGVESTLLQDQGALIHVLLTDAPGLIILDYAFFTDVFAVNASIYSSWMERGGGIALTGCDAQRMVPELFLTRITAISERDPYTLNSLLQRFIPTYSRQFLRMETRLPGLYARAAGDSQICEILNLSPGGAFIRTTESLPGSGEEVWVNVPLLGLHKEVELRSRVVNQILPNEGNNYTQGISVSFVREENSSALNDLNDYAQYVLAHDKALDPQIPSFSNCHKRGRNSMNINMPFPPRLEKVRDPKLIPSR